jgi:elongation factor P--beta-lysine ligase
MTDRFTLIARKHEVQRRIERVTGALEQERRLPAEKQDRRRIAGWERELDALMAEEYSLRLAIDRSA